MHLLKIVIFLDVTISGQHIFQAKEKIGNGGAFFVTIAVVGVLCAVSQTAHEFCYFDVCGAGKSRNAVVTV